MLTLILILLALVLAAVAQMQAKGQSLVAWAVMALAILHLMDRL